MMFMKKGCLFIIFAMIATGGVSCKRMYICRCAVHKRHSTAEKGVYTYEIMEKNKKYAKMLCNSRNYRSQDGANDITCTIR